MIGAEFGERYVPEKPRYFTNKAKNAQEAHEAIRPTDFFRHPKEMRKFLDDDAAKIYDLIWKRAVASQMQAAEMERTTAEIEATGSGKTAMLRAVGTVVRFDGFLAAYTDHREDEEEDEDSARLPQINAGEQQTKRAIAATQHSTEPPPRYSEASLIKRMEELGIGRPSTYASTLKTLSDREYVKLEKRKLYPDSKGRIVTAFLEGFFKRYVEYDYTAGLEEKLDEVSDGKINYKVVLRDFWKDFSAAIDDIKELSITDVLNVLNEDLAPLAFPARADGSNPRICPKCGTGNLSLKLGKFGAFVGCSNHPECSYTKQLGADTLDENGEIRSAGDEPKLLGTDPFTSEEITIRSGRFGPYIQRGDGKEAKRASLPKGWTVDNTDHEKALALLSLPRDIGAHPETGKMISAGVGRYGPYVLHDGTYANVENVEEVFSIGLNRAVTVLADKLAKGPGRGRTGTPAALKTLGNHPADDQPITVRDGKYGAYVNHGKTNATLPKGKDPQSVTLEEALELIAAKAGKAPAAKPARKAAPKVKPAAKAKAKPAAKTKAAAKPKKD